MRIAGILHAAQRGAEEWCATATKKYTGRKNNKTTAKQDEWLAKLNEKGYAVAVCYGCKKAQDKILKYLNLGE